MQNKFNGWLGEAATAIALNAMLDCSIYRRLDNLILPSNRNRTAQIDHAIVSAFGIFVIETKNYAGRIYGDANSPEWYQELCGISRPFPNPLRQNYSHVKALAGLLNYPESIFEDIVFFVGDCVFGNPMPPNVLTSGLVPYILSFRTLRLTGQQVDDAVVRLRIYAGASHRSREHLRNIHARTDGAERCSRCGIGRMVLRTSGRGLKFWGCSRYPACRYTRSLQSLFPQEHFLIAARQAQLSANNQRTCLILNCVKHNPADDMKQFGQAAALVQSGEPNEDHDTREGLFGFAYFGNQWSFHIPSASILTLRKIHVSLNK